jgi:DNA-binding response OmpR family regulator
MRCILIIEDDPVIRASYSTVLTQEGYTVLSAASGQEGLTLAHKSAVHMVLLDMMLPGGMNGFDVLSNLKQHDRTKDIPIIVMTNLESEKQTVLEYGANDFIVKAHIDIKQLVEKVHALLPASAE